MTHAHQRATDAINDETRSLLAVSPSLWRTVVSTIVFCVLFVAAIGWRSQAHEKRLDAYDQDRKEMIEMSKQNAVVASELKAMNERLGKIDAKLEKYQEQQIAAALASVARDERR